MADLVQLELDETDKGNFQELQRAMGEAQRELASLTMRSRTRHAEAKCVSRPSTRWHSRPGARGAPSSPTHAPLRASRRRRHATYTLAELEAIDESARAYEQVGKMFLLKPLAELKQQLVEEAQAGEKDATALTEKKGHVEESYKKIQEDFQEFVKAHGACRDRPARRVQLLAVCPAA